MRPSQQLPPKGPTDPDHQTAYDWMAANRSPLVTTDYVIDETLT